MYKLDFDDTKAPHESLGITEQEFNGLIARLKEAEESIMSSIIKEQKVSLPIIMQVLENYSKEELQFFLSLSLFIDVANKINQQSLDDAMEELISSFPQGTFPQETDQENEQN
jgi:hypothetical protein